MVLGIAAGLVWGVFIGFLNFLLTKSRGEKRKKGKSDLPGLLLQLAGLIVIVLLKNVLPFSYEGALVGAVIAMSLSGTVFAFLTAK